MFSRLPLSHTLVLLVVQDPVGSYMAAPMRLGQELETLQERASGELAEAGRRSSRGT